MEQQRALNALEPFIALSKSATSPRAAADLVKQATSHPQTYVFAEILQTKNIQALRQSPEHAQHLRLLEIFAWGTYSDYEAAKTDLPPLSPAQTQKLRLLSLIPLLSTPIQSQSQPSSGSQTQNQLTYSYLTNALSLPDNRALEALLTSALSSNLITGHLDPLHQLVAATSVAPLRDLAPIALPRMASAMEDWEGRCDSTLRELDQEVQNIRDNARTRGEIERRRKKAFEDEVDKESSLNTGNQNGSGGSGGAGGLRSGKDRGGFRQNDGGGAGAGSGKRAAPMGEQLPMGSDLMDMDEDDGGVSLESSGGNRGGGRGSKKPFSKGGR